MIVPLELKKYEYYNEGDILLLKGSCLDILPLLKPIDVLVTDPVWPNSIFPGIEPWGLLEKAIKLAPERKRSAYILGCDSDPSIIKESLPFFRVCWLRYARPHYKGRLLYSGDVAYYYGEPPKAEKGYQVIGGEHCMTEAGKDCKHPCPRKPSALEYILDKWSRPGELIVDPFAGSCTTISAAKKLGRRAIGIDTEAEYLDMGIERLKQEVLC